MSCVASKSWHRKVSLQMDHFEALKIQAPDRYVLNELSATERDDFEEHLFVCAECAEEVRIGATVLDNMREVVRSSKQPLIMPKPSRERASLFSWLFQPAWAMAAVAVLIAVIAIQNFVMIPRLRRELAANQPQPLASLSLMTAASRGAGDATIRIPEASPFGLYFDIPANPSFSSYLCEVQTLAASTKFAVTIPAEQTRDTVQLMVPGGTLSQGQYSLVIRGVRSNSQQAEEIVRYRFTIENK